MITQIFYFIIFLESVDTNIKKKKTLLRKKNKERLEDKMTVSKFSTALSLGHYLRLFTVFINLFNNFFEPKCLMGNLISHYRNICLQI